MESHSIVRIVRFGSEREIHNSEMNLTAEDF